MNNWIDRHSVNCYFCSVLFDEREGQNADDYNNGDGGSICPDCLKLFAETTYPEPLHIYEG